MTIQASVVLTRVTTTLIDPTNQYWTATELMDYLNAAITALCSAKPDAYVKNGSVTLAAGVQQQMPSDAVQLINAPISAVSFGGMRRISQDKLWHMNPAWPAAATVNFPSYYLYDISTPMFFDVYPPATGGNVIQVRYGAYPARLVNTTDNIPVNDVYESALWAHVLSQAYAKNTVRGDTEKTKFYFDMFTSLLGIRTQAQGNEKPTKPGQEKP